MSTLIKVCSLFLSVCFLEACYSSIPAPPPCFSDGNEITLNDAERSGAASISQCCTEDTHCIERFSEPLNGGGALATDDIIKRFSYCEKQFSENEISEYEDLSREYGTCVLGVTNENSECRIGMSGMRCCSATGDPCREKFGEDVFSCTILVPAESQCDVL